MLLYICVKFHEKSQTFFELQSGHDFVTDRWTDGHTGQNNMSPNPTGGDINMNKIGQKVLKLYRVKPLNVYLITIGDNTKILL